MYRSGDSKVIWCYGLSEAETAERVKKVMANNLFAVESFSLAPVDLPDVEESASDGIIHDTQFAVCAITNWLHAVKRHEKIICERKAERAARLHQNRQNIGRLKAGVAVLTAAGYLRRASWLVQAEKRLDFL